MKKIIVILLLCLSTMAQAQIYMPSFKYYEGELVYADQSKRETGYVTLPKGFSKQITFKKTLDDKPVKIQSDDLFTITVKSEEGATHTFERNVTQNLYAYKGEVKTMLGRKKGWYYKSNTHDKMSFYLGGHVYQIKKDGDLYIKSKGQAGFVAIGYYFKRPDEEVITYVSARQSGFMIGEEERFRLAMAYYLNDNPALCERIKKEEFKSDEAFELYQAYISE